MPARCRSIGVVMFSLEDKVIIVTGANSGIGRAATLLFASVGAHVIAVARRTQALAEVRAQAAALPGSVVDVPGDVTHEDFHARLAESAIERFGRLDGAFNNAGTLGVSAPIGEIDLRDWAKTIDTNLTSAMLAARAQIPQIAATGGGAIVYTGSFVGISAGLPAMSAYAASKAGLLGLVRVLAVEAAASNVRINAIVSGGVDTPMGRAAANSPDTMSFVQNLHAMKRIANPDEIARAAMFLLSDAASFITGAPVPVDGGVSINRT